MPGSPGTDSLLTPVQTTATKLQTPDQLNTQARLALITQGAGAITSAAGAFAKANNDRLTAQTNQAIADSQAANAIRMGDSQAQKLYAQTNQLKGTQRATLAANGADLSGGSPLDILTGTDVEGAIDQKTLKDNTQFDVNAARTKAAYFKAQASNSNPFVGAGASLVTGAGAVSSKWYDDKKSGLFSNGFLGS